MVGFDIGGGFVVAQVMMDEKSWWLRSAVFGEVAG